MKTLFQPIKARSNNCSSSDVTYTLCDNLRTLQVGDANILLNPDIGSWVVLENDDEARIDTYRNQILDKNIGEFLFEVGMSKKNGMSATYDTSSCYTEELYFFEFSVTDQCNLHCKYCFAEASPRKKNKASIELAEIFVDRIAEHRAGSKSSTPVIIEFTGGEPLLNFPVIRHTVEYVKSQYKGLLDVHFTIQSNLTKLTEEQLVFIKEHNVGLGISCDGYQQIHNEHRPFYGGKGSHDRVVKNLEKVREQYADNTGSVISVISALSTQKMPHIMLYMYILGFKEVALRPIVDIGRGEHSLKGVNASEYTNFLYETIDNIIEPLYIDKGIILRERHLSLTFQHLLAPYRSFMCERTPCGAAKNICIVTPDGNVFPCNQAINNNFKIGNIKDMSFEKMINSSKADLMASRKLENIAPCNSCDYRGWCSSPCPIAVFEKYGDLNRKSPYCDILYSRYEEGLKRLLNEKHSLEFVSVLAGTSDSIEWRSAIVN